MPRFEKWLSSVAADAPADQVARCALAERLLAVSHFLDKSVSGPGEAEAIHQFRPAWFEEPVPHTNINAMIEVARRSPVPIATGESLSTKQQFAELLRHDVVSILQPEPLNLGGLFAARKICDMIDAHFGVVAPHSAQGPVCSAACVQLNASIPNFFIHEIFDEFNEPWEKQIVTGAVEVVDGYIEVPQRPGLGIDLNIEEIERHPYQQENYLPLFKPGWERRVRQAAQ